MIAISLFLNIFLLFLNHAFIKFRDLTRIRNTIDHTTAFTIATYLIHSKLDYCNSLLLNLPSTQTKRLQLVLNAAALLSPKLLNFITFLLFLNLFIGSKLMREFNTIKFSLSLIKLFTLVILHISSFSS